MTALYRCSHCGHIQYGPSQNHHNKVMMKCEGECKNILGMKKRRVFVWYLWRSYQ